MFDMRELQKKASVARDQRDATTTATLEKEPEPTPNPKAKSSKAKPKGAGKARTSESPKASNRKVKAPEPLTEPTRGPKSRESSEMARHPFTVRLPERLDRGLRARSTRTGASMSFILAQALNRWVEAAEKGVMLPCPEYRGIPDGNVQLKAFVPIDLWERAQSLRALYGVTINKAVAAGLHTWLEETG